MGVYGQAGTPITGSPPACRVYHSVAQTLTTGVEASLSFNSERYDTDTMHDTVTNNNQITIKTAGLYVVTAHVLFDNNATGRRVVGVRRNGAAYIAFLNMVAISGDTTNFSIATVGKFAVNDYIEVRALQTSGGNLNCSPFSEAGPEFAAMWMGLGT